MVISKFTTLLYYSCKIKRVSAWLGVWNPSKCHQQWPMAKCPVAGRETIWEGASFEPRVTCNPRWQPLFLVASKCVRGFSPIDINWRFMISWKDDMHTSWPGWCLCPLDILVEAVEAISSMYDSTHQFWDELATCQLQKDLCYEPCREIAANRFSRVEQRNTYCFHNHVWPLVLRPPV